MDEAELRNRGCCRHRYGRCGLHGARSMIQSLIGQIGGTGIGPVVSPSLPLDANLLCDEAITLLHPGTLDTTEDVQFAVRQNFAQTPSVHTPRYGQPGSLVCPFPSLDACEARPIRYQRRGRVEADAVLSNGRQRRTRVRNQAQSIMAYGRPGAKKNHRHALQRDRVIAGCQGCVCTLQKRQSPVARR